MRKVCLIEGSRTPIGTFGRSLSRVKVDKLAEHAMTQAIRKAGVQPNDIDGIILGHGYQSGYTPNTARFAALGAGLPASIPAMTVQRQCGSGMEAIDLAAKEIMLGNGDVYLAGGAESMSTVPYLVDGQLRFEGKPADKFNSFASQFEKGPMPKVLDAISRGYDSGPVANGLNKMFANINKFGPRPYIGLVDDALLPTCHLWDTETTHMAGTAQRLADTYEISREDADEYACRSHSRALEAQSSGRFDCEVDPIEVPGRGFFKKDEHPRANTTREKLAGLRPVLRTRSVTAGNSSGINDGACAVILSAEDKAKQLGLKPLAFIVDSCVAGVDPDQMGLGPVVAIEKLLKRNNLTVKDIDLFEINEAFAAQYLACEKLLKLDRDKVNVNGGAIALGHPIGMSGARLVLTLAHELRRRKLKRGIASLCIGGGMGIATLIESA
jgi:acetyl-CoA C-acetyltransferase